MQSLQESLEIVQMQHIPPVYTRLFNIAWLSML